MEESPVTALQDFSLELKPGEMLAIVGESGSGKSVMALTLMNLLNPAATSGSGFGYIFARRDEVVDLLGILKNKSAAIAATHWP